MDDATTDRATDPFNDMIEFFELSLRASGVARNTIDVYVPAARKLAGWLTQHRPDVTDWSGVNDEIFMRYMVWFQEEARRPNGKPYAKGYANNQYRALQQFFAWHSRETGTVNPMIGLKPPTAGTKTVAVFEDDQLSAMIKGCERKRDFESVRDTAIIRLFACTGVRLSELTYLETDSINLATCTAKVIGKGDKERFVKFDLKTATALKRYLLARKKHRFSEHKRLWLAVKNRGPMTPNGIRQIVERRAVAVGLRAHPHMFRHNFSHRWLDAGGAEGDLMELNGWESPAMLRLYGRSARAARARRAYDRVNVMGDI